MGQKGPERVNRECKDLRRPDGSTNSKEVSLTGKHKVKERIVGDKVRE